MPLPIRRRWLLVLCGTGVAALSIGRLRLKRATARRVDALLADATEPPERPATEDIAATDDGIALLPDPVSTYFETALEPGQVPVRTVRLEQRGEFKLGDRSGSWKPMTATQHYAVDPPGFIWDADIEVFPLVSARVVDAYERGEGSLRAMLFSAIPVATATPSPAMNEGELLRYLGEAVWFPTALRPESGVEWEAIDDRSARATIDDRGNTASLVFHFDEDGLVSRVSAAERYRQEDDSDAPWTGYFEAYERRNGMAIPTEASVEWNLPDGDMPYWRARITSIEHRT